MHYPSKILGFLQDGEEINAVIQCAFEPVPWSQLKEEFIVKFILNMNVGEEASLVHPICVVPDFRVENKNGYMMNLPNGQWSKYFSRFVNNGTNSKHNKIK